MHPDDMTFGQAIEALKAGQCVARAGWNGKNMFVYLKRGSAVCAAREDGLIEGVSTDFFDPGEKGTCVHLPTFRMKTANGSILTGWLASPTDMLAEDWRIV